MLLLPVSSIYENTLGAFLLQLGFILLVGSTIFLVLAAVGYRRMPLATTIHVYRAETIAWASLFLSFIALFFLLYDKIYVQGIDYSDGIAVAREQWRQVGAERGGRASSVFSAFGYMFGSFYYVSAVLAVTQLNNVRASSRISILFLCFILVLTNSFITGGRSSILLLGAFLYAAFGEYKGIRLRDLLMRASHRWVIKLTIILGVIYMIAVFYLRADSRGDIGISYYVLSFLPYLGLSPDPWFFLDFVRTSIWGGLVSSVVISFSYITHSFSTVAAIVEHGTEDKTVILIHISDLLHKVGLFQKPDSSWFLSGRFPSVPGALWLQFGSFGYVLFSVMLGILAAAAKIWVVVLPNKLLPIGANLCMETILILSPAVFAGDFMSFPFVVFAFFGCACLQVFIRIVNLPQKSAQVKLGVSGILTPGTRTDGVQGAVQ